MTSSRSRGPGSPDSRAVIVGAKRTPFIRSGGEIQELDVLDLARAATVELVASLDMDPSIVDAVVVGNVSRPVKYHNLGREVVLSANLPASTPAHTVSLACASSCQAATTAVDLIERGYAKVVITGGAESLSNVPIQYSPILVRALVKASRARTPMAKLQSLATVAPSDLAPVAPAIEETSTGLTMGQSAEIMAKVNGISREQQDEFALRSHQLAVKDADSRRRDLTPLYLVNGHERIVAVDNHVREDSSMEKLLALKPVFDRSYGTVTAGNSSPLTDGAAMLSLMSRDLARSNGHEPLGAIRSYAYSAVDPRDQLLLGPAYAIPLALDRAGVALSDIGVLEMHEAFASQVLSTVQALGSAAFARDKLGRTSKVGEIDLSRLNVGGGSIALGHPFGATGARVLMDLVRHMQEAGSDLGLASVCAAGGVGCAIVVERV